MSPLSRNVWREERFGPRQTKRNNEANERKTRKIKAWNAITAVKNMKMQSKKKKRKKENCFNFSFKYLWSVDMKRMIPVLPNSGAVFTKILWKVSFMRFNKSFKEILEKINI